MTYIELKNGITGKMDISKPLMLAPDAKYEKVDLDKIYEFSMNLAAKSSANKSELDTTIALIKAAYTLEKLNRGNAAQNNINKISE